MLRKRIRFRAHLCWVVAALVWLSAACGGGGPVVGSVSGVVTNYASTLTVPTSSSPAPTRSAGLRAYWKGFRRAPAAMAPGQVVVKFRSGVAAPSAADVHRAAGAQPVLTIRSLGTQVVRITSGEPVAQVATRYRQRPEVEYAEPNYLASKLAVPTDPLYSSQWHFSNIGLEQAWEFTTGSTSVIVAVIDSGIRGNHEDLQGVTVPGFDFVDQDSDPTDPGNPNDPDEPSHGTHVAGTITALTNNGRGVAGVNWGPNGARIMPLRVVGTDGFASFADVAAAITHAADHGAQVINISLGAPSGSQLLQDAVVYAYNRGVVIVAAAGNGGCGPIDFPAAYSQVIAVGATTSSNQRSSFSDCGPELDVVAPGGSGVPPPGTVTDWIWAPSWSPNAGNTYFGMTGTSMAAPHVSGLAALLIARGTTGVEAVRSRLQSTAEDLGAAGFDTQYGHGKVRADRAVTAPVQAFAADIDGARITVRSSRGVVASTGGFRITNVIPGNRWIVVWQDVNVNGVVDAGDFFGLSSAIVVVLAGQETTSISIAVGQRGSLEPVLEVR